ncbi:MAG: imidazole glycerol phosphate synthase subunit HisH [Clostridiales Family XIII bacterium]|jgi:glutamine amidotransferase|nr:imidazole glycerol phosphate synthase subunit HisH [Clostridiales Family XIII bacterium]
MIAVIDYGAGNIFSVKNALGFLGFTGKLTGDAADIRAADKLILPGVGAFPDAMRMLTERGLTDVIRAEAAGGKPLLGICLGMQILFERGYEFEETRGLGLIEGYVDKLTPPAGENLKIPHMGWDSVEIINPLPLTKTVSSGTTMVYFVHSYKAVTPRENISLLARYGQDVPALVFRGSVYGAQFHPEKSGEAGLNILRSFAEL